TSLVQCCSTDLSVVLFIVAKKCVSHVVIKSETFLICDLFVEHKLSFSPIYTHGERTLDWEKVAFPPFSPEECKQKWKEVIQKMRKVRNLTELIVEAESVLSDPLNNAKLHPEYPKRPMPVNTWYYKEVFSKIKKKNPGMSCAGLMKIASKEFSLLPDKKKVNSPTIQIWR
uniref:HMG box domain-containing protein n=1 Tax=Pundamilia nyererei TaxID=303518 RepID=A0A3B4FUQ3_9CICH